MQWGIHQAWSRFRSNGRRWTTLYWQGMEKDTKVNWCWLHPLSNRAENSSVTLHITPSRYLCPSKKFLPRLISTFVAPFFFFSSLPYLPSSVRHERVDLARRYDTLNSLPIRFFPPYPGTLRRNLEDEPRVCNLNKLKYSLRWTSR